MYRLLSVSSILGLLVCTTLASQAATESPSEVNPTLPSQTSAGSQGYEFAAPPATSADIMYRVDRATGEVGACVFSPKGPTIGSTVCVPAGEGAGPQTSGDYGLISSNSATANGLFRVNRATGEISVCYVLNERVVCTAPLR